MDRRRRRECASARTSAEALQLEAAVQRSDRRQRAPRFGGSRRAALRDHDRGRHRDRGGGRGRHCRETGCRNRCTLAVDFAQVRAPALGRGRCSAEVFRTRRCRRHRRDDRVGVARAGDRSSSRLGGDDGEGRNQRDDPAERSDGVHGGDYARFPGDHPCPPGGAGRPSGRSPGPTGWVDWGRLGSIGVDWGQSGNWGRLGSERQLCRMGSVPNGVRAATEVAHQLRL